MSVNVRTVRLLNPMEEEEEEIEREARARQSVNFKRWYEKKGRARYLAKKAEKAQKTNANDGHEIQQQAHRD